MDHTAGRVSFPQLRVLEIVWMFRLILSVEVVERAVEFVEAMHGRQMLVTITEMVLAKLARDVALRFQQLRDGHVPRCEPFLRAR